MAYGDGAILAALMGGGKKAKKPRKAPIARISVGATVVVHGQIGKVTGRDERYANAWFVAIEGAPLYSYSRDMITVE